MIKNFILIICFFQTVAWSSDSDNFLLDKLFPFKSDQGFAIVQINPEFVTTPIIMYSLGDQRIVRSKFWLSIETIFHWLPNSVEETYTDEIAIHYYVLLANKNPLFPHGTLLTGVSHLISVKSNITECRNIMYITPFTLARFFNERIPHIPLFAIQDIAIVITYKGVVVATKTVKNNSYLWINNNLPEAYEFLLNKNKTPFASLYWDYYQESK